MSDTETEDPTDESMVTLFNTRDSHSSLCSRKLTMHLERNAFNSQCQTPRLGCSGEHLIKINYLRAALSAADSGRHVPFIQVQCQRQIEPCSFDIFACDFAVTTKGETVFNPISLEDGGNWSDFDEKKGAAAMIAGFNAEWVETKPTQGKY